MFSFETNRVAITNLQHQYVQVSPLIALSSGYPRLEKMLGTTVFDLKAPVVDIAGFTHAINQKVIKLQQPKLLFDLSCYAEGLACCITQKLPFYNAEKLLTGVETRAYELEMTGFSLFITELYNNARRYGQFNKLGGIAYEIVDAYREHGLSVQESKILFLLCFGKTGAQIAKLLQRSRRTIEGILEKIKNKLGVDTKNQLVEYAIYAGLTQLIPRGLLNK